MHRHGPSCLEGPVSWARDWWGPGYETEEPVAVQTPPTPDPTPRRPEDAPVRQDLVERVRREIAEGTYDTPEKWDIALERLLRRLEEE